MCPSMWREQSWRTQGADIVRDVRLPDLPRTCEPTDSRCSNPTARVDSRPRKKPQLLSCYSFGLSSPARDRHSSMTWISNLRCLIIRVNCGGTQLSQITIEKFRAGSGAALEGAHPAARFPARQSCSSTAGPVSDRAVQCGYRRRRLRRDNR
jgi:hypothetical protein